jgi:hypothetical protein
MPTVTPTFNWPIPEDTDLVKDGAEAIRDLGNAIDTSAAGFGGGLVHIETRAISAVAAESFNNVFSSTYDNYIILLKATSSAQNLINFRVRVAGTSASGSDYKHASFFVSGGATSGLETASNAATSATLGANIWPSNRFTNIRLELFQPFLAERTTSNFQNVHPRDNGNLNTACFGGFFHNLETSYDGFEIIASTGSLTGNVSIYGVTK